MSSKGGHSVQDVYFQLGSKAILNADETELFELSQLAGITMDPHVFKILLDLLKLNVSPVALANSLHSMCMPRLKGTTSMVDSMPRLKGTTSMVDSMPRLKGTTSMVDSSHTRQGPDKSTRSTSTSHLSSISSSTRSSHLSRKLESTNSHGGLQKDSRNRGKHRASHN